MIIEFSKKQDGSIVLRCVRDDGTATYTRGNSANSHFFVWHDLTHYAIETVLDLHFAFYGIVALGWDFDDFGSPWRKGRFRPEWGSDPLLGETLAGMFDAERAGTLTVTAEFANNSLAEAVDSKESVIELTEAQIEAIRARRDELFQRWRGLPVGETLALLFPL
jgi:hypothetical protein